MGCLVTIRWEDRRVSVSCDGTETLLSVLLSAGIDGVDAPCGGRGRCGKCLVTVTGPVRARETDRVRTVTEETLPACRYRPAGDCAVTVSARGAMRVVTGGAERIAPAGGGLGLAADIGTTTLAVLLYDLEDGRRLGGLGERNVQRVYGADVISRITACGEGRLPALRDGIRDQITAMALRLCRSSGRQPRELRRAVIAGNTVMEHLFDGLDPAGIGRAPFTPASLFGDSRPLRDCLPGLGAEGEAYLCPCLSGYVGGDVTAGLAAVGADRAEGLWLYADIGTNGEMALGNRDGFVTCAAAAGPAFEGAEIACGMEAAPGAVDRVRAEKGGLAVHVLGGGPAAGLCGSGLADAAAALLALGVVDETGRMAAKDEVPEPLARRIFLREDGTRAFRLKDRAYLAAGDVRQVQLAKAAIRAGADTLLARLGKRPEDVTDLVIAGGFGSYLDKNSALRIGMLPPVEPGRIRHAGNAAGAGAALALTEEGRKRLEALAGRCEYVELSSSGTFMERYIDCMLFEQGEYV